MGKEYIIETNYFNNPRTWIIRFILSVVAILVLYSIDLQKLGQNKELFWFGCIFAGLLVVAFFVMPTDDLALDKDKLYYIKKSIIPVFNQTTEYSISNIKGIGVGGLFSIKGTFALLDPRGNRNRMEITFKDNSSKSHDLKIYKKELKRISLKVTELLNQKSA
jgi:hypothetical protein